MDVSGQNSREFLGKVLAPYDILVFPEGVVRRTHRGSLNTVVYTEEAQVSLFPLPTGFLEDSGELLPYPPPLIGKT